MAEAEGRAARRLSVGARVAAGAAAALALAALVGWAAGASRLTTLLESGPSMSPSSALCALLGAWAVFRLAPGGDRPVAARAAALGILAIVAGNLAWAVLGLPLRPEALLLADPAATRMAVPSCIGFALLAAAVATLDAAGPARRFGGGAGIAGLLLGVFAVAGYLIDYNSLYGLPAFAPMSLPTALSLLLLSAAALAVRPGA
ncbi:MAG TPA: hypothetical protein VEH84_13195, partial [Alphaproteobacteria bacterium]|nr:hypothetical protein [Alphaproteobacteria bacterium]